MEEEKKTKFRDAIEKTKEAAEVTQVVIVREVKENSGMTGAVIGGVLGTAIVPFLGTAIGAWVGYKIDKKIR